MQRRDTEVRLKAELNTQVIEDQKGFYAEGPEVQNMAPPTTEHYNHPPLQDRKEVWNLPLCWIAYANYNSH